jgi:hypothetical protein
MIANQNLTLDEKHKSTYIIDRNLSLINEEQYYLKLFLTDKNNEHYFDVLGKYGNKFYFFLTMLRRRNKKASGLVDGETSLAKEHIYDLDTSYAYIYQNNHHRLVDYFESIDKLLFKGKGPN